MADETYRQTAERLEANWANSRSIVYDLIDRLENMMSGEKIKLSGIERDAIIYAMADKLEPEHTV